MEKIVSYFPANINLKSTLFYDIETTPVDTFERVSTLPEYEDLYLLWKDKVEYMRNDPQNKNVATDKEAWDNHAGILPEYGKIVCISLGYFNANHNEFRINTFSGDEEQMLVDFTRAVNLFMKNGKRFMVGAYTSQFDNTYVARRCFKYRIMPSALITKYGIKPWDEMVLDLQKEWKMGSRIGDARLTSMCRFLGIKSPKDDISGKDVWKIIQQGDLPRVIKYCEKDVYALYELFDYLCNLRYIE